MWRDTLNESRGCSVIFHITLIFPNIILHNFYNSEKSLLIHYLMVTLHVAAHIFPGGAYRMSGNYGQVIRHR